MTDPAREPDVHPTVLLIPWYLSGQLSAAERDEVDRHLESCASCREELRSARALRRDLKDAQERIPGPSLRVRAEVFRRLEERRARKAGVLDRISGGLRALLQPKWAPAAALLIIVAQIGALTWLAARPPAAPPRIISRGLPASDVTRLSVTFSATATQSAVAEALRAIGGRIVDGPAADGSYTVELAPGSPTETAARLRSLRGRHDIVERMEIATP
ncbi:MAG TPA: anti-sigma factor [Steroidobacteraceae bacterium]|jgi:anti-sigma factor RsiW